jgi:hypothetical protein
MSRNIPSLLARLLLAGMALLLTITALGQLFTIRERYTFAPVQPDSVTIWQERMSRLIPALPPSGVIGYLSERDFPGLGFDEGDQDEEFAMTQFTIAPRILEQGAGRQFVIVNMARTPAAKVRSLASGLGLRYDSEVGNGIYLFRRGLP